jgi:thioredoxin 1
MKTVYYFTASWCGPCRQVKPIVKDINVEYGREVFTIIDIDKDQNLSNKYTVRSVPTFIIVDQDGKQLKRCIGSQTKQNLLNFLKVGGAI